MGTLFDDFRANYRRLQEKRDAQDSVTESRKEPVKQYKLKVKKGYIEDVMGNEYFLTLGDMASILSIGGLKIKEACPTYKSFILRCRSVFTDTRSDVTINTVLCPEGITGKLIGIDKDAVVIIENTNKHIWRIEWKRHGIHKFNQVELSSESFSASLKAVFRRRDIPCWAGDPLPFNIPGKAIWESLSTTKAVKSFQEFAHNILAKRFLFEGTVVLSCLLPSDSDSFIYTVAGKLSEVDEESISLLVDGKVETFKFAEDFPFYFAGTGQSFIMNYESLLDISYKEVKNNDKNK